MNALSLALTLLDKIPALIQAGTAMAHIVELVSQHRELQATLAAENRGPTPLEWSAINGRLDALEAQLK